MSENNKIDTNEKVWTATLYNVIKQIEDNRSDLDLTDVVISVNIKPEGTGNIDTQKLYPVFDIKRLWSADKNILILSCYTEAAFRKLYGDNGVEIPIPTLLSLRRQASRDYTNHIVSEIYVAIHDIVDNEGNIAIRVFPLYVDSTNVAFVTNSNDENDHAFIFVISEDMDYFDNPDLEKMNESTHMFQLYNRRGDIDGFTI